MKYKFFLITALTLFCVKAAAQSAGGRIPFLMREDAPIRVEGIPEALAMGKGKLTFSPKGTPMFTYRYESSPLVEQAEEDLMCAAEWVVREAFAPLQQM